MAGARILLVEGEPGVQRLLQRGLSDRGFDVRSAASGEQALTTIDRWSPDVLVLNLELAGMSGLDLCRELRCWSCMPIIALSDLSSEQEKVRALELGIDDLLAQPCGIEELSARVRVALRHSVGARLRPEILLGEGEVRIDFQERRVWRDEEEIHLTPREYDLLKYLIQHRDTDLQYWEIVRGVWGLKHAGESHYLRRYVPKLRSKIEHDPEHPRYLLSYHGSGLRLRSAG